MISYITIMKTYALILSLFFPIIIYGQISSSKLRGTNVEYSKVHYSTYKFLDNGSPAELLERDFVLIDMLIQEAIYKFNNDVDSYYVNKIISARQKNDNIINHKYSYRYYLPARNNNGEKIVWVICSCRKPSLGDVDWRNAFVRTSDGGSCYYQIKINLTNKSYYDFFVNSLG